MTLFKIQQEYIQILDQLNETEGEITPEIAAKLEINEFDLQNKAVNYAMFIRKLEFDNEIIAQEQIRLNELKARNNKKIDSLEKAVINAMNLYGINKVETPLLKLSIRESKSVNITDESKLSDNFFTTKTTRTPSKTALKAALEGGAEINGAQIVINKSLQVK